MLRQGEMNRHCLTFFVLATTVSCLTPDLLQRQDSPTWLPALRMSPMESNFSLFAVAFALPVSSSSVKSSGSSMDTTPDAMNYIPKPISL